MNTGSKGLHCTLDIYRESRYNQICKMHDYSDPSVFNIWNLALLSQRMTLMLFKSSKIQCTCTPYD